MTTRRSFLADATLAAGLGAGVLAAASTSPDQASASGSAKKGGKGGKGPDSPSGYSGQMQVTANVLANNRPAGILQLDAGLYSEIPEVRTSLNAYGAMLRAAWRGTAQDFCNRFYTRGTVPDSALLANQLQAATDRVLGPRRARVMMVSLIVRAT